MRGNIKGKVYNRLLGFLLWFCFTLLLINAYLLLKSNQLNRKTTSLLEAIYSTPKTEQDGAKVVVK